MAETRLIWGDKTSPCRIRVNSVTGGCIREDESGSRGAVSIKKWGYAIGIRHYNGMGKSRGQQS